MDRAQKQEQVKKLHEAVTGAGVVVITHYSGLTVAELTTLRRELRGVGASFKVAKNRLTKLAVKDTDQAPLEDLLKGPTALGFSKDPVAAPKILVKFAKGNDKFKILGGMMGKTVLDAAGVENLASLPSLDELRAKLIALLQTPATRIAGVLQAPAGQLARVLKAKSEKAAA